MARARATGCSFIIPQVCYTAQGLRVTKPSRRRPSTGRRDRKPIPLTRLTATREGRIEPIVYWMRIGYDVTNSNWARNALKLQSGLQCSGRRAVRVSTIGVPAEQSAEVEEKFIGDLLNAVPPDTRQFMVGDPSKALL